MQTKKWSKVISIITAIALILCSLGSMGIVSVSAEGTLDMQALVDAASIEVSNDTTQADLNTALQAITLPEGYTYGSITEFYKVKALGGAIERGSTYDGAPTEDLVLVPGEKGAIAATVTVSDVSYTVTLPIEPVMEVYSFISLSNTIEDWGGNNTDGYYFKGWAEKIIVPDEITKFASTWWLSNNGKTEKCIVYGNGRTVIPRLDGTSAEVVVLGDNVTTLSNEAFYSGSKLKYIRLPDTVTSLGRSAFSHASQLKSLYLPEGLLTIGSNLFNGSGYNIDEIIIPSTVTSIGDGAFQKANSPVNITVLTKTNSGGWGGFYDNVEDNKANYANITYRAFSEGNNSPWRYWYTVNEKIDLTQSVTLTEAAARAAKVAYNKSYETVDEVTADADNILTAIQKAYFNVSTITAAWADTEWVNNAGAYQNKLTLTKGETTATVTISIPSSFDAEKVLVEKITVDNDTTAESFAAQIAALKKDGTIPESYTVEVTDFYKVKAFNGAIERGSTYPNAPIEDVVLVEGKPGAVAANITVTSGSVKTSKTYTFKIEPKMAIYSFSTVSNTMNDWAQDDNGAYYYTGQAVDKLVVPDEITTLLSGWWPNWYSGKAMTCIVYGKGITSVPKQTGMKAEVVSFKGEVTTIQAGAFHSATNLKYIRLPDTVTTLGEQAFRKCSSLTQLYLPEGLTSIGSSLFAVPSEDSGNVYSIDDIIIPSTVTGIGGGAFAGAASATTITFLSRSDKPGWGGFYGNDETYKSFFENITFRAFSGTAAYGYFYTVNEKKEITADVTLTEATARAAAKAYDYSDVYYETADAVATDADTILADITAATFGVSTMTLSWKNSTWEQNLSAWENTVAITDGTYTNEIVVGVKAEYDLAETISDADIKVDNNTTQEVYAEALKTAGVVPEDSEVTFEDYYKLNAYNGAVEIDADGNVTETLVEGDKGYMAAVVTVTSSTGTTATANVTYVIEPTYEEYYFSSVSTADNWTQAEDGTWSYSGNAEKIIVPDEITVLPNYWEAWTSTPKWIVYGENLTAVPRQDSLTGLEGVTFKGDKVTSFGNQAFYNATSLKYIKMPDSVTTWGQDVFRNCDALEQLYVSQNLTHINGAVFHTTTDTTKHNVTQITLPASTYYIAGNAFAGAGKECEVTILSTQHNFWNANVFYNADYPDMGKNYTLQVFKDTNQASADKMFATASGTKNYLEEMSVAQATVRAMQAAEKNLGDYAENLASINTQQAAVMASVTEGYFDAGTISANWTGEWNLSGSILTNSIELTDGKNTFTVPVSIASKAGYYAGAASILTSDEFAANGNKQGLRMYYYFDSSSADKISIDGAEYAIKDFGVITAHISNTFAGAEDSMISDDEFVIGTEGISVESGKADTIATLSGTKVNYYTSYIKNIPQGGIDYTFQYRGYITYTNADGADVTVYTDSCIASVQNVFDGVSTNAAYSAMNDWFDGLVLS